MTSLEAWRRSAAPKSRYRREARRIMAITVGLFAAKGPADPKALIAEVDAAYPFGERAMHPYKQWLAERRLLIAALKRDALPAPTGDEEYVCTVAADMLEQGDVVGARKLLDEQAPRRLNRDCRACGAKAGKECSENVPMEGEDRGAFYGVHRSVVRVVPHLARLVDRAPSDSGPLFGARP